MTRGELSRKHPANFGNTTCVVDNLEKEALVEGVHDKDDHRAMVLQLIAKEQKSFQEIFPQPNQYVTRIVSLLATSEQEQLAQLLKQLGLLLQIRSSGT